MVGTHRFRIVELVSLSLAAGIIVWFFVSFGWGVLVAFGLAAIRGIWIWRVGPVTPGDGRTRAEIQRDARRK